MQQNSAGVSPGLIGSRDIEGPNKIDISPAVGAIVRAIAIAIAISSFVRDFDLTRGIGWLSTAKWSFIV